MSIALIYLVSVFCISEIFLYAKKTALRRSENFGGLLVSSVVVTSVTSSVLNHHSDDRAFFSI